MAMIEALKAAKKVSTHSRPKAAANIPIILLCQLNRVSTHSRPKAAARRYIMPCVPRTVSTHSRPKAAAPYIKKQEKSVY